MRCIMSDRRSRCLLSLLAGEKQLDMFDSKIGRVSFEFFRQCGKMLRLADER